MTFIAPVIIVFLLALVFFGKRVQEWQIRALNGTVVVVICVLAVIAAAVIGAVKADPLYEYFIFGLWAFLFMLGMTVLVGLIDLFNRTRFYKIPCFLTMLIIVAYGIVFLIKEG